MHQTLQSHWVTEAIIQTQHHKDSVFALLDTGATKTIDEKTILSTKYRLRTATINAVREAGIDIAIGSTKSGIAR